MCQFIPLSFRMPTLLPSDNSSIRHFLLGINSSRLVSMIPSFSKFKEKKPNFLSSLFLTTAHVPIVSAHGNT